MSAETKDLFKNSLVVLATAAGATVLSMAVGISPGRSLLFFTGAIAGFAAASIHADGTKPWIDIYDSLVKSMAIRPKESPAAIDIRRQRIPSSQQQRQPQITIPRTTNEFPHRTPRPRHDLFDAEVDGGAYLRGPITTDGRPLEMRC